jgi:hypothetical protein
MNYTDVLYGHFAGLFIGSLVLGTAWNLIGNAAGLAFGVLLYWTFLFLKTIPFKSDDWHLGIGRRSLHLGLLSGVCAVIGGHFPYTITALFLILKFAWIALYVTVVRVTF